MGINSNNIAKIAAGAGALLAAKWLTRYLSDYELRGRVVLVTGGSRGLGLVLARQFAREGARVAICARDEAELERARLDLEKRGADAFAVKCDVTIDSEVREMIKRIHEHFGPIDVLVNNAGVIQVGPLETMGTEDFRQAMNTHFWGPLNTILAVLPEMRRRQSGRIVNISSIGGKIGIPHLVPYSASKFALVACRKDYEPS
jgi:NAD(P)-dependent dehydrogenase (short-subunit alcohol dehydrogenase family)